jgi:hypothetical protein
VAGVAGLEVRPFEPPQTVRVGFVHRSDPMSEPATRLIDLALTSTGLPAAARVETGPPSSVGAAFGQ